MILGFPGYEEQARCLAVEADLPFAMVSIHRFPDGESRITLPPRLPSHVILCRSLHSPDRKLVELILAAGGARDMGADTVSLVAPYLCYMRQDKAFAPGEVVSQAVMAQCLSSWFDNLLTVDAHLHRTHSLDEVFTTRTAINISANVAMAAFISREVDEALLIGPDLESEQWVSSIADHAGLSFCIAAKKRHGDHEVRISLPDGDYRNRHIVRVDDVASTGNTLLETARSLAPHSPASISVLVTHALFVGDALSGLRQAGIDDIWSCDSIPHETNHISLAGVLAGNLSRFR